MTYIDRINAFNQWEGVSKLSSNAFRLYHVLLFCFNSVCWPDAFHISNAKLTELVGKISEPTLLIARSELIDKGLIEWERGSTGKESEYRLIDLVEDKEILPIGKEILPKGKKSLDLIDNILSNNINNNIPDNKPIYHKYGLYGWVELTDKEYEKLFNDLGQAELDRCIEYVDESAEITKNKNKWKNWNLVIRKCHRDQWGMTVAQRTAATSKLPDYIPTNWMTEEGY